MNCPVCAGRTIINRTVADCESVHRRRKCLDCGYIFYTAEYETETPDEFKRVRSLKYKSEELSHDKH